MKTVKKILLGVITTLSCCVFAFGLAGCASGNEQGATEKTPYEIWLENGNNGTEEDFLLWLKNSEGNEGETLFYQRIVGERAYRVVDLGTVSAVDIVIPETYKGLPIKEIGANAFSVSANENCYRLESITIPDSVTVIGESAFNGNWNLKSVTIPNSLKEIGEFAFFGCQNIMEIHLPEGLETIGYEAFAHCDGLTDIFIPDSVKTIGFDVFRDCKNLKYNLKDNVKYLGNAKNPCVYLVEANTKDIVSLQIDAGCKIIANEALRGCNALKTLIIPKGVVAIGELAFGGCVSLTEIIIPNSVVDMGAYVFAECGDLIVYCEVDKKPRDWVYNWELPFIPDALYRKPSVYWYSKEEPKENGNYWHYANGIVTKW